MKKLIALFQNAREVVKTAGAIHWFTNEIEALRKREEIANANIRMLTSELKTASTRLRTKRAEYDVLLIEANRESQVLEGVRHIVKMARGSTAREIRSLLS